MMIPMRCWAALAVLVGIGLGLTPGATHAQRPDTLVWQRDSVDVELDTLDQETDTLGQEPNSLAPEREPVEIDSLLAQIRTAYQQLEYEQAEQRARTALSRYDELSPEQLVEVHTILAVVSYARNGTEEARRHFHAALMLDPELELDPDEFPPKIVEIFDEAKRNMPPAREPAPAEPEVRYVTVVDPIPAAAVRSAVLPGWGQIYKGQRKKGRVLLSTWGVAATGLVVSQAFYSYYASEQRDADTQSAARDAYDQKKSWHTARNGFAIAATGIWLYSYLDTILSEAPPPTVRLSERATMTLQPSLSSLRLDIRF